MRVSRRWTPEQRRRKRSSENELLETLEAETNALERSVDTLDSDTDSLEHSIDALETQTGTLESRTEPFETEHTHLPRPPARTTNELSSGSTH